MLLAGSTQDYSAYFTPDDPDAFVLFSGSALTLCAKPSATLEGDTLTVSTSSNYKPDAFVLFVAEYDADGRLLAVHSENITPESGTYTFKVQLGAKIKCFLLRTDTYAPLFGTFSPNAWVFHPPGFCVHLIRRWRRSWTERGQMGLSHRSPSMLCSASRNP